MSKLKEGDRVRILARTVTEQDRKIDKYFGHMQGLTGVIENYYSDKEIAVKIDLDCLPPVPKRVHTDATDRLRSTFLKDLSEEAKKLLTKEELEFVPNYVLLVQASDLAPA